MLPPSPRLADLQAELAADLLRFAPELAVIAGIVLVLLGRMLAPKLPALLVAAAAAGFGLAAVAVQAVADVDGGPAFTGLLRLDRFALALRGLLLLFAVLALLLGRLTRHPADGDAADFAVLLLGGLLGLLLMVSADHLLTVFLGMEMASLPSYALAGFRRGRGKAAESALKYVVYGAAASGVMLYGITLLAGRFGTGELPLVARGYAAALAAGGWDAPLAAGTLLLLVGFGYKLAAVPFHAWLPDVFEGAVAEVAAVLAVASKAAAVGLTARVLLQLQQSAAGSGVDAQLLPRTLGLAVGVAAAVTATVGNLGALGQTNLNRLLGYSTIAHAGYMLLGLSVLRADGAAAALVYLAAYLPMTLGVFAVAAVVRERTGSEEVSALRGLVQRSPWLGVCLAVFLLGQLGLPPLAGFAGKFLVFRELYRSGETDPLFYALLAAGVVNTVVSAGYYLAVLRTAGLDDPATDEPLGEGPAVRLYLLLLAAPLAVFGVLWTPLLDWAAAATRGL